MPDGPAGVAGTAGGRPGAYRDRGTALVIQTPLLGVPHRIDYKTRHDLGEPSLDSCPVIWELASPTIRPGERLLYAHEDQWVVLAACHA